MRCENSFRTGGDFMKRNLNRLIAKFYLSDGINVIATELRIAKMRPTSFYKKDNL